MLRVEGRGREIALFLLVGGGSAAAYTALGVLFTSGMELRPSLAVVLALAIVLPPTYLCLLYTSPSPRDVEESRMPSSA